MCTSPLTRRIDSDFKFPIREHFAVELKNGEKSSFDLLHFVRPFRYVTFPCGKCAECLKSRHSKLAYRLYRECQRSHSVYFLTLTYRNDSIPIAVTRQLYDKPFDVESGEVVFEEPFFPSQSLQRLYRRYLFKNSPNRKTLPDLLTYGNEHDGFFYIAPSLRREDFRLWIKRCRTNYERWNNHKLELKYFAVGEYGEKTRRPHFHMLVFGATRQQIGFIANQWQTRFGHVDIRRVNADLSDGTSKGYAKVSRYISKYCSKGFIDCERLARNFTEKGRILSSKFVGFAPSYSIPHEDSAFRSFQSALQLACDKEVTFDNTDDFLLFRSLSLADCGLSSRDWFYPSRIALSSFGYSQDKLFETLRERQKVYFNDYKVKLPDNILKQLYYYYDKIQEKYVRKPLYVAYQNWLARVVYEELRGKLPTYFAKFDEGSNLAVLCFVKNESSALAVREKRACESLHQSYACCHF